MSVSILIGDVREQLALLPAESIDCVVTSPPYWGLRDYGVEGQIGLERTLGEHIDVMVKVFDAVRRVIELNPDYAAIAARRLKAGCVRVEGGDSRRGLEPLPLEAAANAS